MNLCQSKSEAKEEKRGRGQCKTPSVQNLIPSPEPDLQSSCYCDAGWPKIPPLFDFLCQYDYSFRTEHSAAARLPPSPTRTSLSSEAWRLSPGEHVSLWRPSREDVENNCNDPPSGCNEKNKNWYCEHHFLTCLIVPTAVLPVIHLWRTHPTVCPDTGYRRRIGNPEVQSSRMWLGLGFMCVCIFWCEEILNERNVQVCRDPQDVPAHGGVWPCLCVFLVLITVFFEPSLIATTISICQVRVSAKPVWSWWRKRHFSCLHLTFDLPVVAVDLLM